jgi:hypothetical protein
VSYLYRPTPVVNPPQRAPIALRRPPAGEMRGYQVNVNWRELFEQARRACGRTPWIHRSGAMSGFTLDGCTRCPHRGRCGMGQDDGSAPDLTPDFSSLDYSGAFAAPIMQPIAPVDLSAIPAPTISEQISPGVWETSGAPVGAGSTGFGIPATSPLPPAPTAAAAAPSAPGVVTQVTSGAAAIAKAAVKPTTAIAPTGYAAIPGYGGVTPLAAPSWFSQSTLISGMPNWMLLAGGLLLLVFAGGGGYVAGRR